MADILQQFYCLLARWPYPDRIIVAPLGIVAEEQRAVADPQATRAQMRLEPGEIAVVNAGGVWRWTDFDTLLEAFATHAQAEPASPLRLFVMGLLQYTNTDHGPSIAATEALLYRHRALLGTRITVHNHWDDASRRVRAYTAASGLGLNLNKPTLENWQSHRLRMLDYLAFGVPVIQTRGDLTSEMADGAHAFLVDSGDVRGCRAVLDAIAADPSMLEAKAAATRALAAQFDSRGTYGAALDQIERTPRRRPGDHAAWGDCVLDYASAHVNAELRGKLQRSMHRMAEQLLD